MSKKTASKKTAPAPKPEPVPTIVVMATSNWDPKHVKPAALDRESNRQKMLVHVRSYDQKPVAAWLADFVANPPAAIKKGSKTTYTPKQWITWFQKAGIITVELA